MSVTEASKTLVIIHRDYNSLRQSEGGGRYVYTGETVTYPASAGLHWDASQHCLTIRTTGGHVLAAFVGVHRYVTTEVTVGQLRQLDPADLSTTAVTS